MGAPRPDAGEPRTDRQTMPWAEITSRAVDQEWPDSEQTMTEWPTPSDATSPPAQEPPPGTQTHAPQPAAAPPPALDVADMEPSSDTPIDASPGTPHAAARLEGRDLAGLEAFADLPEEMHEELARAARVQDLAAEEEVAGFGVALVLEGEASVCTSIVDTPALHAVARTLVPSRGSLADGMPLRVVAASAGARVAVWDQATIDDALRTCPWVVDELRDVADRLQALAGATIGPLGDLNEERLGALLDRLVLQVMHEGTNVVLSGHPMPGLVVVGAGTVELTEDDQGPPIGAARPGDLIFAGALLMGQPAPATARAAAGGALLLVGEHRTLRELFEQIPELIPLLNEDS